MSLVLQKRDVNMDYKFMKSQTTFFLSVYVKQSRTAIIALKHQVIRKINSEAEEEAITTEDI